jgi:DNA-binding MarR family transcriptional regulator
MRLNLNGTGECVAFSLRKAARAVTQNYDDALRPTGLRSTQFAILVAIGKRQPISMQHLSELTVIDATTLTRSLKLLAAQGVIEIGARTARRERLVKLTSVGRRRLARAVSLWRGAQKRVVTKIGDAEWSRLRGKLDQLIGHIGARRNHVRTQKFEQA